MLVIYYSGHVTWFWLPWKLFCQEIMLQSLPKYYIIKWPGAVLILCVHHCVIYHWKAGFLSILMNHVELWYVVYLNNYRHFSCKYSNNCSWIAHSHLNIHDVTIPHTLLECWRSQVSNDVSHNGNTLYSSCIHVLDLCKANCNIMYIKTIVGTLTVIIWIFTVKCP